MAIYDITDPSFDPSLIDEGDILNCPYTGSEQSLELPTGKYILEVWGAASNRPSSKTGKGGYSKGTLKLEDTTDLYFYIGGQPSAVSNRYLLGGWNGGGATYGTSGDSGAGGGATDICLIHSDIAIDSNYRYIRSRESYLSRLIVAGGAGGGYSTSSYAVDDRSGGYCPVVTTSRVEFIGSMTAPGSVTSGCTIGNFGYGATSNYTGDDYGGGGGGWYGGGSQGDSYGGGGSSFIWCEELAEFVPNDWTISTDYYLTDTDIKYGNEEIIEPDGNTNIGNDGDGYARITVLELSSEAFTVNYSSQYGSFEPTIARGKILIKNLPTTIIKGKKLEGWYYESSFTNKVQIGDIVTSNLTLYAKWINWEYYTVNLILNGVSSTNINNWINKDDTYETTFELLENRYWNFNLYKIYEGRELINNTYNEFNHSLKITNVKDNLTIYVGSSILLNLETAGLYERDKDYIIKSIADNITSNIIEYTTKPVIIDKIQLPSSARTFEVIYNG